MGCSNSRGGQASKTQTQSRGVNEATIPESADASKAENVTPERGVADAVAQVDVTDYLEPGETEPSTYRKTNAAAAPKKKQAPGLTLLQLSALHQEAALEQVQAKQLEEGLTADNNDPAKLADLAVDCVNDLLGSSVLKSRSDWNEMRELRARLGHSDPTSRWSALLALVDKTEDLSKTSPQIFDYVRLEVLTAVRAWIRPKARDDEIEAVPSFGNETPRTLDPTTPGEQVFILETPRDVRLVLGQSLIQPFTPRDKSGIPELVLPVEPALPYTPRDTPRFGLDERELELGSTDDFSVDIERPLERLAPFIEKSQSRMTRFASAPRGYDERQSTNGQMT